MLFEVIFISFAFTLGLLGRYARMPPLVGFLMAGFIINALSGPLQLPTESSAILDHIAELGVLLLLFTIGLKLKFRNLIEPAVLGGALLHFTITTGVLLAGLLWLLDLPPRESLLLAIALSFSSTVLAAKVLEARRELRAFHGRTAIGILIVQDLLALATISVAAGTAPSVWALGVLALPLLRPVLYWLMDLSGHEELLVLMGMLLAVVLGGAGFDALGLSPEVGALVMGLLLSNHPRAQELSNSLWSLKEVFLVGFFLQIGMSGLPDREALQFAVLLGLLLPVKGALFFLLLVAFRLRARNAFLAALSLTCYSEFGLIVAAMVLPEWLVPLAITVTVSFLVAAPLNLYAHSLAERFAGRLERLERSSQHPDECLASLGDAQILVLGMGRTGTAAYDLLTQRSLRVVGVDTDPVKVESHSQKQRNVRYADAEDSGFWDNVDLAPLRAVVVAMHDFEAKVIAVRQLRRRGFRGALVAHTMYEDEAVAIRAAGADQAYLTMAEAGVGLAEHTLRLVGTRNTGPQARAASA